MEPDFVEADRATRIIAVIAVTILVILVVLNHLTWPRASDPTALETASRRLFITTLVAVPIMLGASVYLLRLGFRVISSGQWPPPGTRMAMRTRIQRGRRAKLTAVFLFVSAVLFVAVVPLVVSASYLSSRAASQAGAWARHPVGAQPR
jgi:hypothetical protein